MRLSTQFRITLLVFSIALIVISVSTLVTSSQISRTRSQENIANNIVQGANELGYYAGDYVIYQQEAQLNRWQSRYESFSEDVASLEGYTPEQQALVQSIEQNEQNMKLVFDSIVSSMGTSQNASRDPSEALSTFQVAWSRMNIQVQTLISDATHLAQLLRSQVDQLNLINFELTFATIIVFAVFILAIYYQTFRRTLKAINDLSEGTKIIGSGNLDYKIRENEKNEIGELSHSFNQMSINLKTVTTSKTELEKAQEALKASEQRWSTTLASIGDAVIATDTEGKVLFMNAIAEEKTGSTLGEAFGKHITRVFNVINEQTRQTIEDPVDRVLKTGLIVGLANHTILVRKNGLEIPIDDSGAPIKTTDGKTLGVVLVFRDVTERRRLYQQLELYTKNLEALVEKRTKQLKQAERMAAIGETAGMVGHDIRNPLHAMSGDVYLTKLDVDSLPDSDIKKDMQENLQAIEENIFYINKIVADLQDYSKIQTPVLEDVNLTDTINKMMSTINVPPSVSVKVSVEEGFPILKSNDAALRRILNNLVLNAIQAMPDGGVLKIFASIKNGCAVLEVSDTGGGIPDSVKPRLFKPLVTTKSKGQGFGLAVVKKLTDDLKINISYESKTGKGTTFCLKFPQRTDE
ncbi:MAG: ATP-binding protein [Candidatus Bathyarchaeia archaeon]|jgi:PAS domain S-box-containing protein